MQTETPIKTRLGLRERIELEASGFSGTIAVYADDFQGNILSIRSDEVWETASCIKVLILAELLRRVDQGAFSLDDLIPYDPVQYTTGSGILKSLTPGLRLSIRDIATLMIIVSDNVATNILIDLLGIDSINSMSAHLGLKHTQLHSKLYFPLDGYLGTTTPKEYAQIFKLFYEKRVGSAAAHTEFFTILKKQHYNSMLTRSLAPGLRASEDVEGTPLFQVASKSGSLDQCRNDGGIFFTAWGDYLLCIFTKDFGDEHYHDQHEAYHYGSRISRLIFDHFLSTGSLADSYLSAQTGV